MVRRSNRINLNTPAEDEQPATPPRNRQLPSARGRAANRGRAGARGGRRQTGQHPPEPHADLQDRGAAGQQPGPTRGSTRGRRGRASGGRQTRRDSRQNQQAAEIEDEAAEDTPAAEPEEELDTGGDVQAALSSVTDFHRLVENVRTNAGLPRPHANPSPRQVATLTLEDPMVTRGTPTNRRRPAIINGLESTGLQILAPMAIERKVKDGWVEHIGLEYLTDAFCLNTAAHSSIPTTSNNRDTLEAPSEREKNLSTAEWMQAWRRFLHLLQTHQPELYMPWREHYDSIVSREGLSLEWKSWLLYDIQIRFASLRAGIDPRIFHQKTWDRAHRDTESEALKQTVTAELQRGLVQTIDSHLEARMRELHPPAYSSPLKRPFTSLEKDDSSSFRPAKRRQPSAQTEASAANPNLVPQQPNQCWPKCFICNSPPEAHGEWFRCDRQTTTEGKPVLLTRGSDGRFVHAIDGRRICYDFNRKVNGCQSRSCTKGEHSCSLCGSAAHGAQQCL